MYSISVPASLNRLGDWCERWDNQLKDGTPATIIMRHGVTLDTWAQAFREMAAEP